MKGGTLDARSRLTPLLGTAMAGVAAGCLLLFAVFARQVILDVNTGLGVLPKVPATAIRQAITLLGPLQTAPVEPPSEQLEPVISAVAPPTATADFNVVAPPAAGVPRIPSNERGNVGRGDVGNLPVGERLPTGIARDEPGEWWIDDDRGDHGRARGRAHGGKGRGHEKKPREKQTSPAKPSHRDVAGRQRGDAPPPQREASHRTPAGHGHSGNPHPRPERKPQARGKQDTDGAAKRSEHGNGRGKAAEHGNGRGKGNGGPPKGRGRP